MRIIRVNTKFIIVFITVIAYSLIFIEAISNLLIKIGEVVHSNSLSFQLGYFLTIGLLMIGYTYSLNNRFIQNKQITFLLFYITAIYLLFRFLFCSLIFFSKIYESLRYADIIIIICLFHIINLIIVELKYNFILRTTKDKAYFIEDGIFIDGEIDNEKILQKLIDVVTNFKPDSAFSIGINAVWGYGKSSFLHRFKNEYQRKNTNAIIFWNRIWKNKGSVAIIENFFEELKNNLKPFSSEISGDINNYVDSILKLSDTDLHKIVSSGRTILNENSTLEKFYNGINDNIKKIDRQVIILLDDLDRLEKPEIMDTLKLIRTLSDFNNVIFIAGYDRKYIVETIETPKNNYLDKIFNVEINLLPFDEQLIIDELIRLVEISFPYNQKESDEVGFNKSFKELFSVESISISDINLDNILHTKSICTVRDLRYQDFLKTYRDVKRFFNEFKFNSDFLDSEFDVVGKEYILLKLLNYRFRDLNNILFPNINRLLTKSTLDEVNNTIHNVNSSANNIYVYDAEAQKRIKITLAQYNSDEIEIIESVLCKLFGSKQTSYYQNNQNAISKIYYTEVYIRNNIAGGKISLSDLQREFSSASLIKIAKDINKSTDSKFQVSNELKQFIFNNEPQSKEQYLDSLRTLNILVQYGTSIDDQKIIDILRLGFNKYYKKDKKTFLFELLKIIKNEPIGYLDKLLSEINMDFKRKESKLDYGERIKTFKNNEFSTKDLKYLFNEKIKLQIEKKENPNIITATYNLFVEKIVVDKKIIRDKDLNILIGEDIKNRFKDYFTSTMFESVREKMDETIGEFIGYEPNFTLAQIFSNPKTQELVIQNPSDESILDKFYREGWDNFNSFIESINLTEQNFESDIQQKIQFMKNFVSEYIKNGYKPLNKKQYEHIFDDLPF
ncbi:hypothetical protein B0A67_06135 [Flavobacterium aquidurense]|nr:hypothetical protein B0A67_06135 [Flavobacterium aquidurense]SHH17063.1 KAP family P-loop domain-containing protein [Flavobacterium frigidimaris]